MDKDDIQLVLLALSTLGTFAIVYLNLPNEAISLPSIPPLVQQIGGGVIASIIAGLILRGLFTLYNNSTTNGSGGMLEDAAVDVSLRELDAIKGCIERRGVAWQGTAHLHRGEITNIEVPFDPLCPNCQTGFIDTTDNPSPKDQRQNPSYSPRAQSTPVFSCPNDNCGHTVERHTEQHKAAQQLFERHARRITESRDEDHSLRSLILNIDGPVTPKKIWREYAEIVDDEQISTNCFH